MKIIAFGDIHMSLGAFSSIPDVSAADCILISGDITNYGGQRDAEGVLNAIMAINKRVFALAGNLDEKSVEQYLSTFGISLHGRGKVVGKLGVFGVGGSNLTPFKTPNEFSEPEIASLLATGYQEVKTVPTRILVSHVPPWNCAVDRLGNGAHVGSKAVRNFIEEKQPALCITGHIHEAVGEDIIGVTKIINPGMVQHGGRVDVVFENGEIQASLQGVLT